VLNKKVNKNIVLGLPISSFSTCLGQLLLSLTLGTQVVGHQSKPKPEPEGTGKLLTQLRQRVLPRHVTQTKAEYLAARHRILVLGAGFGGMATAINLDPELKRARIIDASVLVVDSKNYMLFYPLVWTVASGRTSPGNVVVPNRAFQRKRAFHLLHARVEAIDLEKREVQTTAGARPYDQLVIALGSVTAIPDLPGLREHAKVFHSLADVLQLRNLLIDAIEAAHHTDDPQERQEWLTFVVGGAGDTGIELAATIQEFLAYGLLKEYPWLVAAPIRVVLVGRADRVLPMSTPRTSSIVRQELEVAGIEVLTSVSVKAVTERVVRTSQGEIAARTFFWAAGITAPEIIRKLPVPHAPNGAVTVDGAFEVPGYPGVYVVGDTAWAYDAVTKAPLPPTAQAAEHEGAYVAKAIAAKLAGRKIASFHFAPKGHLALLGNFTAVGEIGRFLIRGFPAWVLWHAYYLFRIPSWRNRLQLLTDWLLARFLGRETTQLRLHE
jgi:NADH:ubiquinone reductase (H+-translocating)